MEFANWLMGSGLHKPQDFCGQNLESMFGHRGARAVQPWDEPYASSIEFDHLFGCQVCISVYP